MQTAILFEEYILNPAHFQVLLWISSSYQISSDRLLQRRSQIPSHGLISHNDTLRDALQITPVDKTGTFSPPPDSDTLYRDLKGPRAPVPTDPLGRKWNLDKLLKKKRSGYHSDPKISVISSSALRGLQTGSLRDGIYPMKSSDDVIRGADYYDVLSEKVAKHPTIPRGFVGSPTTRPNVLRRGKVDKKRTVRGGDTAKVLRERLTDALPLSTGVLLHPVYTESDEELLLCVRSGASRRGQDGPDPVLQGPLSSLQHLTKDFSFGDQFLNDKPSEADNEKTTADTEAESMVSVTIQQGGHLCPPSYDVNGDRSVPRTRFFTSSLAIANHTQPQQQNGRNKQQQLSSTSSTTSRSVDPITSMRMGELEELFRESSGRKSTLWKHESSSSLLVQGSSLREDMNEIHARQNACWDGEYVTGAVNNRVAYEALQDSHP
ncbi:hypothetical protein Tco_0531947 [Tanacetum coccineum]